MQDVPDQSGQGSEETFHKVCGKAAKSKVEEEPQTVQQRILMAVNVISFPVIECTNIPNLCDEIPNPQVAMHHTHLQDITYEIPDNDREADIPLLIGCELIECDVSS